MGVLKVKVNGLWEEISTPAPEPPIDEVWTGTTSPDPALPYSLWVDTNTDPPLLKAKNDIGQWKEIGASQSEVEIAVVDPTATNPLAEIWYDPSTPEFGALSEVEISGDDPVARNPASELWYTPGALVPAVPPAIWDVAVTYQYGDWAQHPTAAEHWRALRSTIGEEPGVVLDAWVASPAPVAADVPGVLKAMVNGIWQTVVSSDATGGDEVIVGPDEPLDVMTDVWFDTDEPAPLPPDLVDVLEPYALKAQVRAHHIYGAVTTSPWTWTLKAGTYLTQFCVSCVASANGIRYANLNMNGVQVAQSKMYFNVTGQHHFMNTGVSVLTIPTDGDYLFDITMSASATMDANDFGHCTLIPCEAGATA